MISAGHQYCIAIANDCGQFRFVGVRVYELNAKGRSRHIDIDVHLLEHGGVFMRRPTGPIPGIGDGQAGHKPAGLHILPEQDVQITGGRCASCNEMQRVVVFDVRIVHNLQRILPFHFRRELSDISGGLGTYLNVGLARNVHGITLGKRKALIPNFHGYVAGKTDECSFVIVVVEFHRRCGFIFI